MRIALAFLFLLLSSVAYAQAPQVTRIDVTEFGIYTADLVNTEKAPGTVTGTTNIVTHMRLNSRTRTIPARKGVAFGFRFNLVGTPPAAIAPLHAVTIFPSAMTDPATHVSKTQNVADIGLSIGAVGYHGYEMDDDWEVLPGVWTFQIWSQGRKLAEESFTVQKQ